MPKGRGYGRKRKSLRKGGTGSKKFYVGGYVA